LQVPNEILRLHPLKGPVKDQKKESQKHQRFQSHVNVPPNQQQ
jgi:hypothetical protein